MKKLVVLLILIQYSCSSYHYNFYNLKETNVVIIYYWEQFFVYEINEEDMNLKDTYLFNKLQKKKASIIFRLTEEQYQTIYKKGTKFSEFIENGKDSYNIDFYVLFAKATIKKIDKREDFRIRKIHGLNTNCFKFDIKYKDANIMFVKINVLTDKKVNSNCSNN